MAKRTVWEFRPDATFVASRGLTLNGRDYAPGQVIDVTGLSVPRMRQLYETRWIRPETLSDLEKNRGEWITGTRLLTASDDETDDANEPLPELESLPVSESVSLPVRRRRPRSLYG